MFGYCEYEVSYSYGEYEEVSYSYGEYEISYGELRDYGPTAISPFAA